MLLHGEIINVILEHLQEFCILLLQEVTNIVPVIKQVEFYLWLIGLKVVINLLIY